MSRMILLWCVLLLVPTRLDAQSTWRPVSLTGTVDRVQPWTGIVLWSDHEKADTDAISLEYSYVKYNDVVDANGRYDWSSIDRLLDQIAARGHQAVLRFYFVYPGKEATVPDVIKSMPDYKTIHAKSEGEPTGFVDWSHPAVGKFMIDFYSQFAERYDNDARLAYLQTGFGLWAEYHIYDGPRKLGETFPTKDFQAKFLRHMDATFKQTPWMISIDSADGDYSPFDDQPELLSLNFGVFDDSFLCKPHARENAQNWKALKLDRWKRAPGGGEFSYYNRRDQKLALTPQGPNGRSMEDMASEFHVSFLIGNDQPGFQPMSRINDAGIAMGYRMAITDCQTNGADWKVTVTNRGIAPMYHDAFVAVGGKRSTKSLKGLLPGETMECQIQDAGQGKVTIDSDRLVDGQVIQFDAM